MKVAFHMANRRAWKFSWFYWRPRVVWARPACFNTWDLTVFWLCFFMIAEGKETEMRR